MAIDFQEELDFQLDFQPDESPGVMDELWAGVKGTGAVAADLAMAVPRIGAQIALTSAGKVADPSYNLNELWKASGEALGEYMPTTGAATGADESLAYKVPMYPFQKYGEGLDFLADQIPNKDVAGAAKMLGAVAPIPFGGKAARGAAKVIEQVDPGLRNYKYEKPASKVDALELDKPEAPLEPWQQLELPLETPLQRGAEIAGERVGQLDLFGPTNRGDLVIPRVERDAAPSPVPNEAQGGLPFKTSVEEIAAKQAEGQPQKDMFVEQDLAAKAYDPVMEKQAFEAQARKQEQAAKEQKATQEELMYQQKNLQEGVDALRAKFGKERQIPRGQRGAVNMEVFDPAFEKIKELANGIKLIMKGSEEGPVIYAMQNGKEVGRLGLTADEWFNPKPDSNLQAAWVDTYGAPKTGLSAEMYKFASEQGDIVPSKAQTASGKEMWQKFEQQGVSKGMKIPRSQRGGIDLEALKRGTATIKGSRVKTPKGIGIVIDHKVIPAKDDAILKQRLEEAGKQGSQPVIGGQESFGDMSRARVEELMRRVVEEWKTQPKTTTIGAYTVQYPDGTTERVYGSDIETVFSGPKSMRGGIDFNALGEGFKKLAGLNKNSPETIKAAGEIKKDAQKAAVSKMIPGLEAYRPTMDTPEKVVAAAPTAKDLTPIQKFTAKSVKPGIRKVRIATNNPLVNFVGEATAKVFTEAENYARKYITDKDGIGPLFTKLSDKEMVEVHQALMAADRAQKIMTPEQLARAGFTKKQIDFISKYYEMEKVKLDVWNEKRLEVGLDPVKERVGHAPGIFTGDYKSMVLDKDGKPIGFIGTDTKYGYNKVVAEIKKKFPGATITDMKRSRLGGQGPRSDLFSGVQDLLDVLAKNDPRIAEVLQAVDVANAHSADSLYNANKHALAKKGIWGNEGNKPWQTDSTGAAKDFFKAYFRYWEEGMLSHLNMPVEAQIKGLMNNPELANMPRAKEYVNDYIQHMTGRSVGDVGMALNTLLDTPAKVLGLGPSVSRESVNQLNKRLGQQTMGWLNMPFLATQYLQLAQTAMPEFISVANKVGKGIPDQARASAAAVKHALNMAKEELGGQKVEVSPEVREMFDYAKARGLLTFSEFEDVGKITQGKFSRGYDKFVDFNRRLGEQGTRPLVFFNFVELLKDSALPKAEVFDTAYNLTQDAMVDYSARERPLMFQKLGVAGQLAGGLQTFMFSYVDQMAKWGKNAAKGDLSPMIAGLAVALTYAGIQGLPFYQEADELTKLVTDKFYGEQKTIGEIALSDLPDWARYGGISAYTGLNAQSRLSAADVLPNSVYEAVTPYAGQIGKLGEAVYEGVKNPDALAARNLALAAAPSSMRGAIENQFATDEKGTYLNKRNEREYERTPFDRGARYGNMTSLEEYKNRQGLYDARMKERADVERKTELAAKITRGIKVKGPSFTVSTDFAKLRQEYIQRKGNPSELDDIIIKAVKDKNMNAKQRAQGVPNKDLSSIYRYQYFND